MLPPRRPAQRPFSATFQRSRQHAASASFQRPARAAATGMPDLQPLRPPSLQSRRAQFKQNVLKSRVENRLRQRHRNRQAFIPLCVERRHPTQAATARYSGEKGEGSAQQQVVEARLRRAKSNDVTQDSSRLAAVPAAQRRACPFSTENAREAWKVV